MPLALQVVEAPFLQSPGHRDVVFSRRGRPGCWRVDGHWAWRWPSGPPGMTSNIYYDVIIHPKYPQMLHVWNIYHTFTIIQVKCRKPCSIHGAYGYSNILWINLMVFKPEDIRLYYHVLSILIHPGANNGKHGSEWKWCILYLQNRHWITESESEALGKVYMALAISVFRILDLLKRKHQLSTFTIDRKNLYQLTSY